MPTIGGVITRSNHPDALWPGVKSWFGKKYDQYPAEWSQIFEIMQSDKAWEYVIEATGFGPAVIKAEGASVTYDSDFEGVKQTFTNVTYGLGYIVTREEVEDDLYAQVSRTRAASLAQSMRYTKEVNGANILNRAFSGSYVGGDSVALASASHPTASGLQSNLLTAADFSETSLEDALKQIAAAKNARGLLVGLRSKQLVVSLYDMFNMTRVLQSELRTNTANNDINATKAMGMVPQGVVNHYLTDTDAWFVQTTTDDGLICMDRRALDFDKDNEFDTENLKAKATERYTFGWGDFRGVYCNAGA